MQSMDEEISLGRLLCEARESKGLSVEEVANELRISSSIIKKIEADDYDLGAKDAVFMRGYIRLYARLVNLSEDEVGDVFQNLGLVTEVQKTPKREAIKVKQVSFKDKPIKLITNFVIIALIVLLLIWWYSHFVANNNKAVQSPVVVIEQPEQQLTNSQTNNVNAQPEEKMINPDETGLWHNPDEVNK